MVTPEIPYRSDSRDGHNQFVLIIRRFGPNVWVCRTKSSGTGVVDVTFPLLPLLERVSLQGRRKEERHH